MNIKDLDFPQMRLLDKKPGTLYVMDGKTFVYQGKDRYDCGTGVDKKDLIIRSENKWSVLDPTKDTTIDGYFWFHQEQDYFVLAFIDDERNHLAIIIRSGEILKYM